MRKIALLVVAAAVVTAVAGSVTMVSHHAVAVSQSAPTPQNTVASSTRDGPDWTFAPEPIMPVGDSSAGN